MRRVFLLLFVFFLAAASACGRSTPTPSPTPTASPTPARSPTPIPSPTPTVSSPTATPILAATYTPPVNPVINQVKVQDAWSDTLTIIWWTDRPTTGRLEYGLTDQYGLSTPWSEGLTTVNGVSTEDVKQDTTYHFRVRVKDAAGNETVTEDDDVVIYRYTLPRAVHSQAKFENNAFYPPRLTIDRNTLVTWTNRDTVAHTVKGPAELLDSSKIAGTAFTESPVLAPGQSYDYIFADPGTYTIVCGLHPSETQEIVVK
jgi:plastocyanin